MNLCECGCGGEAKKRFIRGHHLRKSVLIDGTQVIITEPQTVTFSQVADLSFDGPPPHPLPIDRRRWRLAEDRPVTPVTNPWIKTYCNQCRQLMWTRDPKSTYEEGGFCEECAYIMREDLRETGNRRAAQMATKPYNPFGGF